MNYIVTTTINPLTEAIKQFSAIADWRLVIVGDKKTPHHEYLAGDGIFWKYLTPEEQEEMHPALSTAIGWNTIQRRNFGFMYAYKQNAQLIATVDDDNIPYSNWPGDIHIGNRTEVETFCDIQGVLDPLSVTEHKQLWHRGYPLDYVAKRKAHYCGPETIIPDVQAGLWNGDPDVDAICRITQRPNVVFNNIKPFSPVKGLFTVFNSQNTILSRKVIPYYMVFPFVGRMDDIWGSYILQRVYQTSLRIVFTQPTVFQKRNDHDLYKDLEKEMIGYKNNNVFSKGSLNSICETLPQSALKAYDLYTQFYGVNNALRFGIKA